MRKKCSRFEKNIRGRRPSVCKIFEITKGQSISKRNFSDWEKLLKFKAEGQEFAKKFRSLKQFILTEKVCIFTFLLAVSQIQRIRTIKIKIVKNNWDWEIYRKSWKHFFSSSFNLVVLFCILIICKVIIHKSRGEQKSRFGPKSKFIYIATLLQITGHLQSDYRQKLCYHVYWFWPLK